MATKLEREAEEYANNKHGKLQGNACDYDNPNEYAQDGFKAGWRACRAAIAKRRWNERLDTFDLANFGEKEEHEQA